MVRWEGGRGSLTVLIEELALAFERDLETLEDAVVEGWTAFESWGAARRDGDNDVAGKRIRSA